MKGCGKHDVVREKQERKNWGRLVKTSLTAVTQFLYTF